MASRLSWVGSQTARHSETSCTWSARIADPSVLHMPSSVKSDWRSTAFSLSSTLARWRNSDSRDARTAGEGSESDAPSAISGMCRRAAWRRGAAGACGAAFVRTG